jgi:hypothetical protein
MERVGFRFDESPGKPFFFHQREQRGVAAKQFFVNISAFIRVWKRQVFEKVVQVREKDFEEPRCRLPEKKLIVKSNGGIEEFLFPVSDMIKEKLEIAFVFIDKNDDVLLFRLLNERGLESRNFDAGKQEIQDNLAKESQPGREIAGKMVVNPDEFGTDPFFKFSFDGCLYHDASLL